VKVLIADDDQVSRRLLEATLRRWGHEVVSANDGQEAWEVLQADDAPKLAILDWMMPHLDGTTVCRLVRQKGGPSYTYLVLATSRDGKKDLLEGLEAGADDYLTKPIDLNELRACLRVGQRILDWQEQLMSAREALREQATKDHLTGLWNRRSILEMLDREVARSQRDGLPLGLIVADLDFFKRVNDTHGHQAGDVVLRETARRMQAAIRPYDTIGRYGGEEFLVVLPNCDAAKALQIAERLHRCVGEKPIDLPEAPVAATLSVGVTAANPSAKVKSDALLKVADDALYQAKRAGRNRVLLTDT
jgi:two-component system, cell cycle response regulator